MKRAMLPAMLVVAIVSCFGATAAVPVPGSVVVPAPASTPPPAPAVASAVATMEKCGVVYQTADGTTTSMLLPSLHVFGLTDDSPFTLPPDAPARVKAVQCVRDVIVPQRNDYRVLLAGFPFLIVSDTRAAALEAADGKLQFRFVKGEIQAAEQAPVQKFLDRVQPFFEKPARAGARPQ